MKKSNKYVKQAVVGGVTLGVGASVLGGMGQGQIANHTIAPAGRMLGVATTAGMGMSILNMANKYTKNKRPVKVKKGKHKGYGRKKK